MKIDEGILKIINGENLTEEETRAIINEIMRGEANSTKVGGFLIGLRVKGETSDEVLGAVKALRDNMITVDMENREHLIDTCGTGGDGGKTFNISTAVAIVAASGGVKVAKHGNRAVSSKSGSADVLTELGIKVDYTKDESKKIIEEKGMAFLFAPQYHKAMKNVAKERKELATRTLFNLIGPLANPAPITGQLLGVYDGNLVKMAGEVLLNLGLERAMVVHGDDGLDEITTTTTTTVCEVNNGVIKEYKIDPVRYGIEKVGIKEIEGGSPKENSEIIINILKGEKGPKRDIVVLNAAAAFYVAKVTNSIEEGIELANSLLDSGKAFEKLREIQV
ncbi:MULTISPECIES: anthranilate phosphoribosyltransferase [Clostridium]|uniref:Anthranilate phosphoribosyltransferase n=1 Tax=Clostridium cibarium TaxID=2762247 RepID=A0ABR8PYI4_9CLOT|nr:MULTISPECIES: anthranilate phosphoribosyltransferase [Clostridium]MBD7913235.1 anthranilate phosphoribosyltransferase [Clostridium cibarium]